MADRRTRRSQRKLETDPPLLSNVEIGVLSNLLLRGFTGKASVRQRLASKGLVSSPVGSKAYVTALGRKALVRAQQAAQPKAEEVAPEPEMSHEEMRYQRWARKHDVQVRKGCWG